MWARFRNVIWGRQQSGLSTCAEAPRVGTRLLWLGGRDPVGVFRENVSHSPGLLFQGLTLLTPDMVTAGHVTPRCLSTKLVAGGLLLAVRPSAALQGGLKPGFDCAATLECLQVGEQDQGVLQQSGLFFPQAVSLEYAFSFDCQNRCLNESRIVHCVFI